MNRLEEEANFYNEVLKKFNNDNIAVYKFFEAITAIENKYILTRMGGLCGKRILDFGCGTGESSVYFASKGAKVIGLDVSQEALKIAQSKALKNSVSIDFILSKTESLTEFENNSFDFIYGHGALHHIDCSRYYPEFKRILSPQGRAYFIEPLKYNPLIAIYRKIATEVRSPGEKPLGLREIKLANRYFKNIKISGFWFFALYLFCHFYLIQRSDPNKYPYWIKIIAEADSYKGMFTFLNRADRLILKVLPPLKYLCWNVVIELERG